MTAGGPRRRKRSGGKSALLEQVVESLELIAFHRYTNHAFKRATVVGDRYFITHYPHPALYGGKGFKEALIVGPSQTAGFVPDEKGVVYIILEAKWQETSGSVDEKMPYIWEAFRASDIPNWVVVMDGPAWKTERGKAAKGWLQVRSEQAGTVLHGDAGCVLHVTDRRGFTALMKDSWGASS